MPQDRQIECPACGSQFKVELSIEACQGCPLTGTCGKKKCPYCGREFIPDLRLIELSEEYE
ncbi:MAG: hypothetical protein ABEJ25_00075 [Candidatus Bipolaricaulia bacterium]